MVFDKPLNSLSSTLALPVPVEPLPGGGWVVDAEAVAIAPASAAVVSGADEWRWVRGSAGQYQVSRSGQVRSWAKRGCGVCRASAPTPLVAPPSKEGYRAFTVRQWGGEVTRQLTRFVHREVAYAFHGQPPFEGAIVRHLDGDPLNNRADNLAWGTLSENSLDREAHGRGQRGKGKLTIEQARRIRASGHNTARLARRYGVTPQSIRNIRSGATWRWLD